MRLVTSCLVVVCVLLSGSASSVACGAPPTFEERLERIVAEMESSRAEMHIPGMSLAIVKDGEIVLARGFGVGDVETGAPVTEGSIFAAGSTTKAFTAAVMAQLVDEGVLSWDDAPSAYLPMFSLSDPEANAQLTLRDLLCHRTGLASLNLLWYAVEDMTRAEILETASKAELLYGFREQFNYSNICFLAAGVATARAEGTDWDAQVRARIFDPLGMGSTTTRISEAKADTRLVKGYRWDDAEERLVHQAMRDLDAIAPAGAINSNVLDMAQWVRLQLGKGVFEGERLISEAEMEEMWSPQMEMQEGIDYGLGWMLRDWEGRRVIEHAGGIDGFTAQVAFMPEEGIGYVLLMNLFASPLQEMSRGIVFDGLLGEWEVGDGAGAVEDLSPYLGEYIANFAHFSDATFTVLEKDGALAIDIPGQMVFEMKAPDEDGLRAFALTDQIKIEFHEDEAGQVTGLTLHQSGFAFEVPRKGFEKRGPMNEAQARAFVGDYRHPDIDLTVTVLLSNGWLAVDVPGEIVYEMKAPDAEGWRHFRITDEIRVRFNEGEAGDVASLTMWNRGESTELMRTTGPAPSALPTTDELLEMMAAAYGSPPAGIRSVRIEQDLTMRHVGVSGHQTSLCTAEGDVRNVTDLGRFGDMVAIVSGEEGWTGGSMFDVMEFTEDERFQTRLSNPFTWMGDWRDVFDDVVVTKKIEDDDRDVYEVRLSHEGVPDVVVHVDAETHLMVGRRIAMMTPMGMTVSTRESFEDHRVVDGMMMPFRTVIENEFSGVTELTTTSVEWGVEIGAGAFTKPE